MGLEYSVYWIQQLDSKLRFHSLFLKVIFFSLALQPRWALVSAFAVSWSFLQTVGLLGRVISSSQGRYLRTGQHKHRINTHNIYPCLMWDSNPQSQLPSERWQLMYKTARLLWPAGDILSRHEMRWGVEVHLHSFLTSEVDEGVWSASLSFRFTPAWPPPLTHWREYWVNPIRDKDLERRTATLARTHFLVIKY
jgi:hypothetical protein